MLDSKIWLIHLSAHSCSCARFWPAFLPGHGAVRCWPLPQRGHGPCSQPSCGRPGSSAVLDRVHVQGRLLFLAAVAAAVSFALYILRWHLFLRALGARMTLVTSARTPIIGFGFSMTPGRACELVQSALLEQQGGLPVTASAPVLLLERALDGLAFLALALAVLPFTPAAVLYVQVMQWARLWTGLLLAVTGLAAVATIVARIAARRGSGPRLPLRFRSGLAEFRRAASALLRPGVLASSLACSLAARSADALAVWVVMAALASNSSSPCSACPRCGRPHRQRIAHAGRRGRRRGRQGLAGACFRRWRGIGAGGHSAGASAYPVGMGDRRPAAGSGDAVARSGRPNGRQADGRTVLVGPPAAPGQVAREVSRRYFACVWHRSIRVS